MVAGFDGGVDTTSEQGEDAGAIAGEEQPEEGDAGDAELPGWRGRAGVEREEEALAAAFDAARLRFGAEVSAGRGTVCRFVPDARGGGIDGDEVRRRADARVERGDGGGGGVEALRARLEAGTWKRSSSESSSPGGGCEAV